MTLTKQTYQSQSNAIYLCSSEFGNRTHSSRLSSICSIKFDWFVNRTHTKLSSILLCGGDAPSCNIKLNLKLSTLKFSFYLNSSSALLCKQQQKPSLIALNSALFHVTTGKEHAKKASMTNHDGSIRLQLKAEASTESLM